MTVFSAGEQLIVPAAIQADIIAHSRAGWPEEVCGILAGRDGVVTGLLRAANVAADRRLHYTVDPAVLLRQFEFEEAGEEMIAIYHSHPLSPAYPSATDAAQATYPDAVTIICSLQQRQAPVLAGFRLHTLPYHGAAGDFPLRPLRGRDDLWAYQHPQPDAFYLLRVQQPGDAPRLLQVRITEVALRSA